MFDILNRLYLYLVFIINDLIEVYKDPLCINEYNIFSSQSNINLYNYNQSIPKILHQTHETNLQKRENYIASQMLVNMNPEYEFKFYTSTQRRAYIKNNFNEYILKAYDKINHGTTKSDLFRYCVLYIEGGIYIDCKSSPVEPFRNFLSDNVSFQVFYDIDCERLSTGFIACEPENKIILNCINQCVKNVFNDNYGINPLDPTGPSLLTTCSKSFKVGILGKLDYNTQYFYSNSNRPLIKRIYSNYISIFDIPKRHEYYWIMGKLFVK